MTPLVSKLHALLDNLMDGDPHEMLDLPAETICVYVSGSLLAGWGHANSDLDFYVIHATDTALHVKHSSMNISRERPPTVVKYEGNTRWDIEYWAVEAVEDLFDRLDRGRDESTRLGERDLEFLFRLSVGRALVGSEWLAEHKRSLDQSPVRFVAAARSLNGADGLIEDALGLLTIGDLESAVLAAHVAFGMTIDALLATYGAYSQSFKWRARKMQAVRPQELDWDTYWQIETMSGLRGDPRAWVEDTVLLCREIAGNLNL